jgi:hypothetical protein
VAPEHAVPRRKRDRSGLTSIAPLLANLKTRGADPVPCRRAGPIAPSDRPLSSDAASRPTDVGAIVAPAKGGVIAGVA